LCVVGVSTDKYLQQDRCLRGWHNLSITGQHLVFLVLTYFCDKIDPNCILEIG